MSNTINSLSAIDHGVSWIDSTVSGIGRGAGNVKTEQLVYIRKNLSVLNEQMFGFDIFLKVAIVYLCATKRCYIVS